MNYYNEFNPDAAAWLRELIRMKLIPDGVVDDRSITEVTPDDLRGFIQCHFFAGVGGWSYALQLAGWGSDRPVWTGSCPCQPFSSAGKRKGKDDERHLWPVFFDLIRQCRPPVVLGEQVASAIGHGWLDDLCLDLEGEGYACGSAVLPACGVGAFHKRDRLWWVANNNKGLQRRTRTERADQCAVGENRMVDGMADALLQRREQEQDGRSASVCGTRTGTGEGGNESGAVRAGACSTVAHSESERVGGGCGQRDGAEGAEASCWRHEDGQSDELGTGSATGGIWDNPQWIYCRDDKYRPIESSIQPLANGLPKGVVYSGDIGAPTNDDATQEARKMRLHGYGNAIVPQVAAVFVQAIM